MKEEWRDSISMGGYEVSNRGNVRNKKRMHNLVMLPNGNGYSYVSKKTNSHKTNYYVHRLVAETFCDNPNQLNEINHKDANKKNNISSNLEWCTRIENIHHAINMGLCVMTKERRIKLDESRLLACQANRKKVVMLNLDNEIIKAYNSLTEASLDIGVSIASVSRATKGHSQSCMKMRLVVV